MPGRSPLEMPTQSFSRYDAPRPREARLRRSSWRVQLIRLAVFGGALALTVFGAREMYGVVGVGGVTALEWGLLILFVINFSWISLALTNAILGLLAILLDRGKPQTADLLGRTAVVMPTYNEDPARAFAESCGLPTLPGRPPLGGMILSHDFVEAALIRRAGWDVYMLPHVGGSYEESPPTLIDLAIRDRRWCQGNLQHSWVLLARGLKLASRQHLATGIMSYLASPIWMAQLLVGIVLVLQAHYVRPEYFTNEFQLLPAFPESDPARALQLFGLTMVVLLMPRGSPVDGGSRRLAQAGRAQRRAAGSLVARLACHTARCDGPSRRAALV